MGEVRQIFIFIFLIAYSLTFFSNAALAYSPAKVKITHAHEHGADHHYEQSDKKSDERAPAPHGTAGQHSHEVCVGGSTVVASLDSHVTVAHFSLAATRISGDEVRLPSSPTLLGIFRPPIA